MPARPRHREAIVDSAIKLFRLRGYSATGLNDIVDESGAPKGSLYHYFPKGKASIAEAAVTVASRRIAEAMTRLSEQNATAGGLVRAWGELLAKWMAGSNFRAGSPVTTTLLELAPDETGVTKAGRKAFGDWRRIVSDKLAADGVPPAQADRLAALVIASLEGGLIQCRVEARPDILLTIAGELERLLETVVASLRKA